MDLYLVRHAIAFEQNSATWPDDSERPLDPAEMKKFRRAAQGLRSLVPEVGHVFSSPYTRAVQTAEILASETGWPQHEVCPALAPGSGSAHIVKFLARFEGPHAIALVGHQPDLGALLSYLLTGSDRGVDSEFRKGGVAAVVTPNDHITPAGATLNWMLTPSILRSLPARRRA